MTNHEKILRKWSGEPTIESANAAVKNFLADTDAIVGQVCTREKLMAIIRARSPFSAPRMFNALHILGYFDTEPGAPGTYRVTGTAWLEKVDSPSPGVGLWCEAAEPIEQHLKQLGQALEAYTAEPQS